MKKVIKSYVNVIIILGIIGTILGTILTNYERSFIFSYVLGTIGAVLYVISLYYDIINLGLKKRSKKGYYIRYLFSASLFLLVGVLFKEKVLALLGVFLGLINVKIGAYIVGFLIGGENSEKKD
ncbi:ATPase [Thermosipho sp. 1070]|uniref:ATPase n=1 Tax=Thermosipho sp. 1070 TaxID=1437364 RepID=UPI0009493ECD|nr:ATPase [Thermosipho sp. 1070]ANQ53407.1 F-ATPase I-subunit [Thermosipho sp. 1070]